MLHYIGKSVLYFTRIHQTTFNCICTVVSLRAMNENSCYVTFGILRALGWGNFKRCIDAFHFNLPFPNGIWCWWYGHLLSCHLNIFPDEMCVYLGLLPILKSIVYFLLLTIKGSSYILVNDLLLVISVVCLLIFLKTSATE